MQDIAGIDEKIESRFSLLSPEEKTAVISHGVAIRHSEMKNRLFLAQSKILFFEKKYGIELTKLEEKGLSDDADYETHEDYIMWNHWTEIAQKTEKQIELLGTIAECGVYK